MALLGLTLLIPSLSWAVSLGRLSLNSALNQPLAATIDLTNVRSLSSDEIRVGLAPKGAFEELGVQGLSDRKSTRVGDKSGFS